MPMCYCNCSHTMGYAAHNCALSKPLPQLFPCHESARIVILLVLFSGRESFAVGYLVSWVYFVEVFLLQTCYEGRMYQLRIECGADYPDKPPNVWFLSRINMKGIESNGRV